MARSARQVHDTARRSRHPPGIAPDFQLTVHDDEQLVVGMVHVRRWTASRWCDRKAEAQPSRRMSAFKLELRGASERVETASRVGRDDYDVDIARGGAIDSCFDTHDEEWDSVQVPRMNEAWLDRFGDSNQYTGSQASRSPGFTASASQAARTCAG